MRMAFASTADCVATWSCGSREKYQTSPATTAVSVPSHPSTTRFQMLSFWIAATSSRPERSLMNVAIRMGTNTSAGFAAPSWARNVMIEMGTSVTDDAFITMNNTISSVARSGSGLRLCSSFIAFNPSGVAALSRPSMFAERFITMAPLAGCPAGMPGKRRRKSGPTAQAMNSVTPPFSAIFMSPSHRLITPVRPIEISNAVFDESKSDETTSFSTSGFPPTAACQIATMNAMRKNAAQIQLSMARSMGGARGRRKGRTASLLGTRTWRASKAYSPGNGDRGTTAARRGCPAREELEALGAVPRRAPVGHRGRGLLREGHALRVVHARARPEPRLPVGRGRHPRAHRPRGPALLRAGAVERARPDLEGAPVRAHRARGQSRRGREGGLPLPRLHTHALVHEGALQVPAGGVPVRETDRGEPPPRRERARVRDRRHRRVRRWPLLGRDRRVRQGLARGHSHTHHH